MTTDLFTPTFIADRYRIYAELRETSPVAPVKLGPSQAWLLTRFEDVAALLRDQHMQVRRPGSGLTERLGDGAAARFARVKMSVVDPPDHTRLRKLVAQGFTPRVIAQFRGQVEKITSSLLDELADRNEIDIVRDFAGRLPADVLCGLTGVPASDWELLISKVDDFLPLLTPFPLDPDTRTRVDAACQFYLDYFGALVDGLVAGPPRDDLLGALLAAEEEGSRLTRDELIATLESFINAGYETTTSSITNGLFGLLSHREQFDRLARDPSGVPNAVEEILRWEAPVQFTFRFAAQERVLHDTAIQAGDTVIFGLGAANRDPRRFHDPDELDVARTDVAHLSFSAGRHFCLGAHLARLEAEVALAELVRRFPRMELAGSAVTRRANPMFPALDALPVVLDPTRRGAAR